ncbi:MAG: hypothetical protein ABI784_04060 [Ginsengibacter sp.]
MKTVITLFILFAFWGCNSPSQNAVSEKENYEAQKAALQKKEQKDPALFLKVIGHDKKNLLGQTVVKGSIHSSATIAVFKDVDIKLSFYSKTKALLETDKETIFEQVSPGQTKDFKTKYFAPKGTDSVALEVLGAKVVE